MAFHRPVCTTNSSLSPCTAAGIVASLVLFLSLILAAGVCAQEPTDELFSPDTPVELSAERLVFDKTSGTYTAQGSVVLIQGATKIEADNASLNTETNIATATGNIVLTDEGGNRVTATALSFNTKDKSAELRNGFLYFQAVNTYISGDPLIKTGPETYTAGYLTYTTCNCAKGEKPDWSFTTTDAKVTIGQFLTGRHSFFRVRNIPVAYTPFLRVPIKRKRQSGLLKPELGFSPLRGFMLNNSFFWARSKNTDATFYLDYQSRRGTGEGVEYRYIRNVKSFGELYLYHFKEKDMTRVRRFRNKSGNLSRPTSAQDNRWQLKLKHSEFFDNGFVLKTDLHIVSDDEFLLDFGNDNEAKSLESLESNISLSKSWSGYSLVIQLRLFDNLLAGDDSSTFKKLPEVTFTSTGKQVRGSPLYVSLTSSYINFTRTNGFTGHRLDVTPRFTLPMRVGGYFDFTPFFSPRGTLYVANKVSTDWYLDRFIYTAGFDTSTTFSKVYRTSGKKLNALKHNLRPSVAYTFIPKVDQADLPKFDAVDTIAKANRLTYSLNSTVTGRITEKNSNRYHEFLYFNLLQSYDFNEAKRDLTVVSDRRRPFSDITFEAILKPSHWSTLSSKIVYNVYDRLTQSSDVELQLTKADSSFVHFTYRYVKDSARYLEANADLVLTKSINITYDKRFSFSDNKSLEASYGITYKKQCWTAHLNYVRRLEEKAIYLNFDLLGIGKVAGISANIESE